MRKLLFLLALILTPTFARAGAGASAGTTQPTVHGSVKSPDGKPLAGAAIILYYRNSSWGYQNKVVEKTASDEAGHYHFDAPLTFKYPSGTDYTDHYLLFANHPDHALAFATLFSDTTGSVDLQLTKPRSQTLRISQPDGTPVAGAAVFLSAAGNREDKNPLFRNFFGLPEDIGVATATTDAQGLCTVKNLPNTWCSFSSRAEKFGVWDLHVSSPGKKEAKLTLIPSAIIRGKVTTEDAKPLEGAAVWFRAAEKMHYAVYALTNADGRYEMNTILASGATPHATGKYYVTVKHPNLIGADTRTLNINQNDTIDDCDFTAIPGSLLRVTVVDCDTKNPVPGARIGGFFDGEDQRIDGHTDWNGIVEFRMRPATGKLYFASPPADRWTTSANRTVPITVGGDLTEYTFETPSPLHPYTSLAGKAVLPRRAGEKTSLIVRAIAVEQITTAGTSGFYQSAIPQADGSFTFPKIPTHCTLRFYAETEDRKFAGTFEHKLEEGPITLPEPIKLIATQKCDVPLTNKTAPSEALAQVKILVSPIVAGSKFWREARTITTDAEGHLKLDGILPGLTYYLQDARYQEINNQRNIDRSWFDDQVILIPE